VNVKASGVCHTDLHAASGDWPVKPNLPFIPGHEAVGLVAKVGKGVIGLNEGDQGKVRTTVSERRLEDINDIFAKMKEGQIEGRIVLSQL
jgi:D-arabinose 1-dehydrogenase-like Zn-dependent alcohol dehydrogenase